MTADRRSATPNEHRSSALADAAEAEAAAADADAAAADAEAAAAEAEARAAAARARAIRSRLLASMPIAEPDAPHTDAVESTNDRLTAQKPARSRGRSLVKSLTAGVAVALVCACSAASGYLMWRRHDVTMEQARAAELNAAARQGVVNLMSVDFNKAQEDVKRLQDSSTGKFRDDLTGTADALTQTLQQAKVVTTVTVGSTAVESMTADSGVVLVAATSEAVDTATKERKPAQWRISVTLTRDGGQLKMSEVDFVTQ